MVTIVKKNFLNFQIDKSAVVEPPKKALITISRDGDTTESDLSGSVKAPMVHVKTPIAVKRTEPGRPPVLSSLVDSKKGQVMIRCLLILVSKADDLFI